ncbi:MAG TPA: phenylalanine--tRNA ligase subunit beta [Candidatus Paceibacterota bacterium]|nr:phenylalanine--tRNA ligase subunit beta [Candidatus Paceibacterota bacterium]
MKISRTWLNQYFEKPLPNVEQIADAFTFHAFEIDEVQGDMLDVKVLPNRAADCLSHRGLAKELSAILDVPLAKDPLRELLTDFPKTNELTVTVEDSEKCLRYMGAVVKGVKVGPSPAWLKETLESVGQRSINNVVDATNYVMLNLGQPLHAFDASKLKTKNETLQINVQGAQKGEKITTLTGDEFELPEGTVLIADGHSGAPLGIAGVKGGKMAEVGSDTTDLVIEAAHFEGTAVRRTAQALKLFTDASLRFQNRPSPELAAYAMRDVLALITQIAGGEVVGVVDTYAAQPKIASVTTTLSRINGLLGSDFSKGEVESVCMRLGFDTKSEGETFTVIPPFERTDITIPEDLAEEVGQILGYDRIAPQELEPLTTPLEQGYYRGIERAKDFLVERGFTEISTQSFAKKGDITLANPLDKDRPALRTSLAENMKEALVKAKLYAPRALPPKVKPKLFEVGAVFPKEGEKLVVETSEPVADLPVIEVAPDYTPIPYRLGAFVPFSVYPFITRDIALWVPVGIESAVIEEVIRTNAGSLLVRLDQFDRFEKEGRVSYAFRLAFESMERTLTDGEANAIMEKITAALQMHTDWQVR